VLARDHHHGGALTDTGKAYFRQEQYESARRILQQAVAVAANYQAAHYYLGLTFARLGRREDSDREVALATKMADADSKVRSTPLTNALSFQTCGRVRSPHFSASISVGAEGETQTSDDTESSADTRRTSLRQNASGRSFRSSDPDGRLRF